MVIRRSRRKQLAPFGERLQEAADEAREAAGKLPEGPERDMLLRRASQAETAAHINEWLTSPGLKSPIK
jgi:hypothetical protein